MMEEEMMEIGDYIHEALSHAGDGERIAAVRGKVLELTRNFPLPG